MSVEKQYSEKYGIYRVTFSWKDKIGEIKSLKILGDFNDWNRNCEPMKKTSHRIYKQTIRLKPGKAYQFRYLVNEIYWEDVDEADLFVPNGIDTGDFNSLIRL
jgi:hypothetical protein